MRPSILLVAFSLLTAHFSLPISAQTQPSDGTQLFRAQEQAFRAAAARIAPCVVTIETIGGTQPTAQPAAPGSPPRPQRRPAAPDFIVADGPTTGLIHSADGLILTSAFNFVRDPSVITVVLPDGRRFVAELLARDEVRQLAMLKIDARDLPVPKWVDGPGEVRVGQWALALGRGFGGADCALTAGIISGLNRQAGLALQTDAKLSPANFGGPLVDLDGRVLGLCVPMGMGTGEMAGVELYDSGIGFAVPHSQVARSAKDLAIGHSLRRGLLGIALEGRGPAPLRVAAVANPSPAARAGLKPGDVVLSIDGQPMHTYPELQRQMRPRLAGQHVTLRVRRAAEELDLPITLAVPEDLGQTPAPPTQPESSPPDE